MKKEESESKILFDLGYSNEQIKFINQTKNSQVFSGYIGSLPASKEMLKLMENEKFTNIK